LTFVLGNLNLDPFFAAKPLGFFARVNNDFTSWMNGTNHVRVAGRHNSHDRRTTIQLVVYPKLEIVMHLPTRRAYCAKHGIPFEAETHHPTAYTTQPSAPMDLSGGGFIPPPPYQP